ncbi:hypothetical protein [Nostoc sp.]|uniref:hypothetical protein n=1 Tax=Nostoc sp. TaxID=1180 RepID=UPI002FF539A7
MADDINPRQFSSLDYNDADLYGGLSQRPAPATPLEKAIAPTQSNRENASTRAMEKNLWESETARNAQFLREQREQAIAREEEIVRRQQARRQEIANRISNNQPKSEEVSQPPKSESPLTQQQRSTPERQPQPSTGSPPPTPSGTAARANPLVEPTATPAPAALAEPMPSPAPKAGSGLSFSSLPTGVGRAIIPGVFTAANFADRVVHGQPITQAASGAGASLVGGIAGGIAGELVAGPIGGVVGSIIGGYVGGAISDWFFQPPNTGSPPTETPNYPPFLGGQEPVAYHWNFSTGANPRSGDQLVFGAIGPISDFTVDELLNTDTINGIKYGNWAASFQQGDGRRITGSAVGFFPDDLPRLKLLRVDNKPDLKNTISHAPPPDNEPYRYNTSPIGKNSTVPSGTPAAGNNKNDKKTKDVAPSMPSGNTPNGNSFFPGHGGLAPSKNPNPTQAPSNLGGQLPATKQPPPPPLPFAEPDDIPAPRTITFNTPGGGLTLGPPSFPGSTVKYDSQGNVLPTGIDGEDPYSFKANPLVANPLVANGLQPSGLPSTKAPNPISDADSATPKSNTAPKPETTNQAETRKQADNNEATKKAIEQEVKKLTEIGALIAGLTPIIQGIPDAIAQSPTVQAANKKTTKDAVCEVAQPGGCLGNALDDSADKINQNSDKNANNLLDKINVGANTAQLALLELINTKLGNLLPDGGISAFLQNFFDGFNKLTQWLHLDRALNILTFVMTVQNVYFLCDSLKVVTLQMISDMLAVVGIKDKDNNPLNLNEILGHEVEELLKSILGEQELSGFKKEWKALNRIYQAATNTLFAIQNMVFSVLQALEIIGSWNASIGNALKKYLVVGQHAFNWMNPNPNFHNNFFKFLGNALNVVTSLDFVAQSILQGRQAIEDFDKQTDELTKGISDAADGFKPPEHKATAEAATNSANVSKSPTPSPEEVKSIQD